MFVHLPSDMDQLDVAVLRLDQPMTHQPPVHAQAIGQRLRQTFERTRSSGYAGIRMSDMRQLPYAYWSHPDFALSQTDSTLVHQYWDVHLPAALRAGPRRAKRWLLPLMFTYCAHFQPRQSQFLAFSARLVRAIQRADGVLAQHLSRLHDEFGFFSPVDVTVGLTRPDVWTSGADLAQWLEQLYLWPGFVDTSLGQAVLQAALQLPAQELRQATISRRVIEWVRGIHPSVVRNDLRIRCANALLGCWVGDTPSYDVKIALISFMLETYGDPRRQEHLEREWQGVSSPALNLMLDWLHGYA